MALEVINLSKTLVCQKDKDLYENSRVAQIQAL